MSIKCYCIVVLEMPVLIILIVNFDNRFPWTGNFFVVQATHF